MNKYFAYRNNFSTVTVDIKEQKQMSFEDVSFLYVRILRMIGLLPFKGRDYDFFGTRIIIALYLCGGFIDYTMILGYSYTQKSVTVDTICEVVMVMGMHFRYYVILSKRAKLLELMDECRAIWYECISDQGHRIVMMFERRVRRLMMLLAASFAFITVFYTGNALSHRLPALEPNGTERRMMPYKWYIENVEDHWPGYWISFSIQESVVLSTLLITTGCDTVSPFLMTMMSGYFRYLANYFYSSTDQDSDEYAHRQYSEFVRYAKLHQRLLEFCMELEEFGRMVFLIQIFSTGYNISLFGIKIVGSDPDKYKYIPMMSVTVCQLLLCQWAPDILFTESSQIATALYFSSVSWMESSVGKLLILMIARAQHPVQMTAGGIVNLSLERFGSMMTSAVSFFTMLRNFNL